MSFLVAKLSQSWDTLLAPGKRNAKPVMTLISLIARASAPLSETGVVAEDTGTEEAVDSIVPVESGDPRGIDMVSGLLSAMTRYVNCLG